jgi:hypothetical protein
VSAGSEETAAETSGRKSSPWLRNVVSTAAISSGRNANFDRASTAAYSSIEYAQQMAAHESARTTKLYDRRNDQVTLDQLERIVL